MLKSTLCDYRYVYTLAKRTSAVAGVGATTATRYTDRNN